MGKLSRLRLKSANKYNNSQEGVGEAELAVLSGGVLPADGGNEEREVAGKDGSHGTAVSGKKGKSGKYSKE